MTTEHGSAILRISPRRQVTVSSECSWSGMMPKQWTSLRRISITLVKQICFPWGGSHQRTSALFSNLKIIKLPLEAQLAVLLHFPGCQSFVILCNDLWNQILAFFLIPGIGLGDCIFDSFVARFQICRTTGKNHYIVLELDGKKLRRMFLKKPAPNRVRHRVQLKTILA